MGIITETVQPGLRIEDLNRAVMSLREDVRQIAGGEKGSIVSVVDVSSAYTIKEDDDILCCWGDTTITLIAAGDVTGKIYWIKDISTNQITIDSSTCIDDVTRFNLDASQSVCIADDGAEWRIISGYSL